MSAARFNYECLVLRRTGKRCLSCRSRRRRGTRVSGRDYYQLLRLRKICVRCQTAEADRGVFCSRCRNINQSRNRRIQAKKVKHHEVRCHRCKEIGHFKKTCVNEARR